MILFLKMVYERNMELYFYWHLLLCFGVEQVWDIYINILYLNDERYFLRYIY